MTPDQLWQEWRRRYLSQGRVSDPQQGFSHSEGQGYGLLLAQAFGDRAAFEAMEQWSQRHLAVRQDRLMAWKWVPGPGQNIADWHNATDGDLFRAWALLRAARHSGWAGAQARALAIARDLARLCLAPDPRAPGEWLLIPGAEARRSPGRVLLNPSYILPRALRELGEAAEDSRLIRAADHGETVLAELAATGLLPNWVDVTPDGFRPAAEHPLLWGYDALRIPLYLVWSGRAGHAAVAVARARMRTGAMAGHVVIEADPRGQVLTQSNRTGFRALLALSDCATRGAETGGTAAGAVPPPALDQPAQGRAPAAPGLDGDYYADCLRLLTVVAAREGGCPNSFTMPG